MPSDNPVQATTPTLAQMEDAARDLRRQIAEDRSERDHWPEGRWPMLHRLEARIEEAKRVRQS